jgi:hypothetical protein
MDPLYVPFQKLLKGRTLPTSWDEFNAIEKVSLLVESSLSLREENTKP